MTSAVLWSLLILILLAWGIVQEEGVHHLAAREEVRSHSRRWEVTLGLVWLLGLAGLGYSIRNVSRIKQKAEAPGRSDRENLRREVLLEAMFDSMADAVLFLDTGNCVIMVNPAFTELTGYSLPELLNPIRRVVVVEGITFCYSKISVSCLERFDLPLFFTIVFTHHTVFIVVNPCYEIWSSPPSWTITVPVM